MKRRNFIRSAAIAGTASLFGRVNPLDAKTNQSSEAGFDLHPFVRRHPEAVFICETSIDSKGDAEAIRNAGFKLSQELIIPRKRSGYPNSTKITIKPNWTCARPIDGKPVYEKLGVNTDPNFVEGWVQAMKETGPEKYYIRESACPNQWKDMGWEAIAERNGIDLKDLSSKDFWDLEEGDINFVKVPRGVVFKEIGYMAPMNEYDTFLINIAKMKAHSMGISGCIKNLQGICGRKFCSFCNPHDQIRRTYDRRYHKFFQHNFEDHIEMLYAKHVKEGIPRWDKPREGGGLYMEEWAQRTLDSMSVTPTGLNIVEGIYSQDGSGFGNGPHETQGPPEVTSIDYMSNIIIFGADPFRVDIINFYLAGHEPGNFGLFHLAFERCMSDVLDPNDIPVYIWKDGKAQLTSLDKLKRTPLVTAYLTKNYNGQNESTFHLVNEPFDYSAWKENKHLGYNKPAIEHLGYNSNNNPIMELTLPEQDNVYVDVLNSNGERIWRLIAKDLESGAHQVVWDGFDKHGMYQFYIKGMGWDAVKQIVTFS